MENKFLEESYEETVFESLIRQDVENGTFHAQNIFNPEYLKPLSYKYVKGLEKENADLNRDKTELTNSVTELKNKVTELESRLKKMKCCLNCKHQTPKTKDDFLFCCECKQLDEQKEKSF